MAFIAAVAGLADPEQANSGSIVTVERRWARTNALLTSDPPVGFGETNDRRTQPNKPYIGAKVVSHGRYVTFQMAEVAVSQQMFAEILSLIARLRAPPAPA